MSCRAGCFHSCNCQGSNHWEIQLPHLLSHAPSSPQPAAALLLKFPLVTSPLSFSFHWWLCLSLPSCYLPDLLFYCQISLLRFFLFFCQMVLVEQCCGAAVFFSASQCSSALASLLGGQSGSPFWFNIWIHVIRGKYIDFLFTILYLHVKRRIQ